MDTILFILSALPAGLEHCGHLHRTLSQPHLKHVSRQIQDLVDEVSRQPSFRELLLEDVIELAIAPTDDPRLSVWASSRGLKLREFLGSPYDSAEINRTKSKIYSKQKQLPPNTPNFLVIANDGLFLENHDFMHIIREFEEALYEHPHVLFLAVIGRWYGGRSVNSMQIREHRIAIQESQTFMFPEARIIMLNKFAAIAVSRDMQRKILDAMENRFSR